MNSMLKMHQMPDKHVDVPPPQKKGKNSGASPQTVTLLAYDVGASPKSLIYQALSCSGYIQELSLACPSPRIYPFYIDLPFSHFNCSIPFQETTFGYVDGKLHNVTLYEK